MPEVPSPRRYTAFISYRHADNREAGRRWAEWIHQALETFHVPRELVGRPGPRGEPVPPTLYPVFRDEDELPADADLTQNLVRALEHSATLVVVCSPRAVASRFVDQEIRTFKELGKPDRILALVVDGEPNAEDAVVGEGEPRPPEALPHALRFGARGEDGRIDWSRRTEPIAADARPGGRPEQGFTTAGAYGEALRRKGVPAREAHRLQREYAERLDLARLKVVAGVLGVPLGQLRARDAVYRARRFRRLATVLGSLALVALVAAAVAVWQGRRAERNYERAEAARAAQERQVVEASRHAHAAAERELRAGHWQEGVTWLGRALRYHRHNGPAAAHLWSAIAYGTGDRDAPPLEVHRFDGAIDALAVSPDGRWLGVATARGRLVVRDTTAPGGPSALDVALPPAPYVRALRFDPLAPRLLVQLGAMEVHVASWGAAAAGVPLVRLEADLLDAVFAADGTPVLGFEVLHGLQRFDPVTGRRVAPPPETRQVLVGAALDPYGTHALLLPDPQRLLLLDVAAGTTRPVEAGPPGQLLLHARLSPRGAYAAHVGGGALGVWDLADGAQVLRPADGVLSWPAFAFDPRGDAVVVDATDGLLEMRSLPEGRLLLPRIRHAGGGAHALRTALSSDGLRLVTGGADGRVAVWPRPGARTRAARVLAIDPVAGARWLSADRVLLVREGSVEVRDLGPEGEVATLETGPAPGGVVVADDGSWIAVGGPEGRVRVWDPATQRPLHEVQGPALATYALTAVRGPLVVATGYDLGSGNLVQRVQVLDAVARKPAGPAVPQPELSHLQGLSADGRRLLCRAGVRATWRAWNVADGTPVEPVSAEDVAAVEARDARAGVGALNAAASKGSGGRAVRDLATGLPLTEPFESPGAALEWSPDGRRMLSVTAERAVLVHETPLPGPPGAWFEDLVAAASGLQVDEVGLVRALTVEERQAARTRLAAAAIEDPTWDRLVRWWLRPPASREGGP